MVWELYVRRTKGRLIPGRLVASGGKPGNGWELDSSFEADDDEEALAIAGFLAEGIDIAVERDWQAKHDANVRRYHGAGRADGKGTT